MKNLDEYLLMLNNLISLQTQLVDSVDQIVRLKPAELNGLSFLPATKTIASQLEGWPKNLIIFPLHTWVEPNRGEISINGSRWLFSYTGQGISFLSTSDNTRVIVEYSVNGKVCLTEWGIRCFLQSSIKNHHASPELMEDHYKLFVWLVKNNYLIKLMDRPEFPESVFLLATPYLT
ncbi:MAG: hypothetical protein HYZ22_15985 [Chloroflexi bacterium]|nr:hypothetical protein [Chloroflexota bacterium]